jgi:hypothetical protein
MIGTGAEKIKPDSYAGIPHGVPDDRSHFLPELLAEARRLHRLGRPVAEVRKAILSLNSALDKPLPPFSPGGLCDCVNAVLAREGA